MAADGLRYLQGTSYAQRGLLYRQRGLLQCCSQTFATGGARHPEGPLTSQGPPNFNFLFGFRPLYFENMKTRFFKCAEKNVNVPAEGPLTTQGPPNFNFLLGF